MLVDKRHTITVEITLKAIKDFLKSRKIVVPRNARWGGFGSQPIMGQIAMVLTWDKK